MTLTNKQIRLRMIRNLEQHLAKTHSLVERSKIVQRIAKLKTTA